MIITYIHLDSPEDELQVRLRCRNFSDAINRVGWHSAHLLDMNSFIQDTPDAHKVCAASDLLIVHLVRRCFQGSVLQAIAYWKAHDKKVIVDFDQAIGRLTPDVPGDSFWLEDAPLGGGANGVRGSQAVLTPLEEFKQGLGMIDAAIVSSSRLMADWPRYMDVHEVPDYLNTDQYPGFKQAHEDEIWIGVANGTRNASMRDSGLLSALENVCRRHPHVKLVTPAIEEDGHGLEGIRASQRMSYPLNSFEEWADILPKLDIGLLPICGDYDLRLGRISLLEFMVSKTPWLVSNQPVLRDLARFGKFVQNTPDAWETAILKAMDNMDTLQKRAAGEPFLFALSQDINVNIDKVLKLFTRILIQAK